MNKDIQNRLRMLYRQVERGVKPAANQISENNTPIESDTLRKEILERDVEVRYTVDELVDAILEDIADPNRCDSFSELDEERIETAKHIIREDPELYYRSDWEEIVGTRVHETGRIEEMSIDKDLRDTIDLMHTPEVRGQIETLLMDMQAEREYKKDPHNSRGVSEKNIVGV